MNNEIPGRFCRIHYIIWLLLNLHWTANTPVVKTLLLMNILLYLNSIIFYSYSKTFFFLMMHSLCSCSTQATKQQGWFKINKSYNETTTVKLESSPTLVGHLSDISKRTPVSSNVGLCVGVCWGLLYYGSWFYQRFFLVRLYCMLWPVTDNLTGCLDLESVSWRQFRLN